MGAGVIWLFVCLSVGSVRSQDSVFRSSTTHVWVDVIVTDSQGNTVDDLRRDDFQLVDQSRSQRIADFEHVVIRSSRNDLHFGSWTLPSSAVSSNATPPPESRAIVLAIDDGHVSTHDIVTTKNLILECIRNTTQSDKIAVVYLNHSEMSQDFTTDAGLVLKAVDRLAAALGPAPGPPPPQLPPYLTEGLANFGQVLASAPQLRRIVVLVSSGMAFEVTPGVSRDANGNPVTDVSALRASGQIQLLDHIFDGLRQKGVEVYPIDPAGLASPESVYGIGRIKTAQDRAFLAHQLDLKRDFLRMIAENTHGIAFVGQSNLKEAAARLMADNGNYYALGYYPDPTSEDGRFHPVEVRVSRPGVHVRARAGYTATKPPVAVPLERTLGESAAGGDLHLEGSLTPLEPTDRGSRMLASIELRYGDTGATRSMVDSIEMVWLAVDPDGKIRASGRRAATLNFGQTRPGSVLLDDVWDVPRGTAQVRVAVSSTLVHQRGTLFVPTAVPAFKTGEAHLLRPMVVDLLDAGTVVGHLDIEARSVPQVSLKRLFTQDDSVPVTARIWGSLHQPVAAEIRLVSNGTVVRRVPGTVSTVAGRPELGQVQGRIALDGIASGSYGLEVVVQRASGKPLMEALSISVK